MDCDPVELDEHRGMAAQKSIEIRRRSHEVPARSGGFARSPGRIRTPSDRSPVDELGRSCGQGAISDPTLCLNA